MRILEHLHLSQAILPIATAEDPMLSISTAGDPLFFTVEVARGPDVVNVNCRSKSYITKSMFGIEPADVDRERVRENARKLALGIKNEKSPWEPDTEIAQAYADEAEEVEKADWALGD